jgi:hypothetical protein
MNRNLLRRQFLKAAKCDVEVCRVEHLAAVDQGAVDRDDKGYMPLGIEALV